MRHDEPPQRLLKAMLLQILFTARSERLLVKAIDYNLLYRGFVGLSIDDPVWDHSTFSRNRDRLFNGGLARVFFEGGVLWCAGSGRLPAGTSAWTAR